MAKENKTKYAILGVLSRGPASGYDIKKFCDNSISHFWNENYGHIYPVLRMLEQDGWVEKTTEISENKLRHVYKITPEGSGALAAWLELPSESPPTRYEFLLKMFFSKDVPLPVTMKKLADSRAMCRQYLQHYKDLEQKMLSAMEKPGDTCGIPYMYATLRYGLLDMEAKLKWLDECEKLLSPHKKEENQNEKHTDL